MLLTSLMDTATPNIENPNFIESLKVSKYNNKEIEILKKFFTDGYVVLDLNLDENFILNINNDLKRIVEQKKYKTNFEAYHYNESPRIVEAWKESSNVKELVWNEKIIQTLKLLYQRKPIPFSTINFIKGTSQPMHSDNIHFDTIPARWLTGVWVALEDVDESNGPLTVFPGSHKLPTTTFQDLDLPPANRDNLKKVYTEYEKGIEKVIASNNLQPKEIIIKKGMAIIWSANTLHGGKAIKDENRTRKSQVIHYHYEGCTKYFNPLYSEPHLGKYKERFLKDIQII